MRDLLAGLSYPFRAFEAIRRNPGLWNFVLIPILVNVVVGATIYAGLLSLGFSWIAGLGSGLLTSILQVLLAILLLLALGYLLVRFGVLFGSPWYGQLSQRLEQQLTGQAPPAEPLTFGGISRDLQRALLFELKKLLLILLIGAGLLLLNLIPVAGQILATIGGIGLGATIACLDFFDSPLERRRMRFRAKLGVIRRSMPASAGFGLICLGLVSIPLINLLAIPLCVTAGTLFFCDRIVVRIDNLGSGR